jgi:murein DD-endopeptidase MepM/ murein hydrolase activator NlpD
MKTLAQANRLTNHNLLRVGQRLVIPGVHQRRRVVSRCPCPDKPSEKSTHTVSKRAAVSERTTPPIALIWPLNGTITRRFNRNGSQRHDGIDISAPRGSLIRAAAEGKVIFSDWGPGGYGRLVIVAHASNLVTVYAHNERNLVQRHQRVEKGQAIATVGRSGRASSYHLHFEVRHKTVPKPPFTFLPHVPQQQQVGIQDSDRSYTPRGNT